MFSQLNPPARDLHAKVERIYGRSVALDIETHDPVFGAVSNILDDGTPYILLNDAGFDPHCTLVHELFHLKHRAEGEPSIYRLVGKNVAQERADLAYLALITVSEFVSHSRFFGLMESMGYYPRHAFDQYMRQLLAKDPRQEISHPLQQPLVVSRVLLEASDHELAQKVIAHFPGTIGPELAAMVGTHDPVEIADRLLAGHGTRLEVAGYEERPKGQVVDRVVVVRLGFVNAGRSVIARR